MWAVALLVQSHDFYFGLGQNLTFLMEFKVKSMLNGLVRQHCWSSFSKIDCQTGFIQKMQTLVG